MFFFINSSIQDFIENYKIYTKWIEKLNNLSKNHENLFQDLLKKFEFRKGIINTKVWLRKKLIMNWFKEEIEKTNIKKSKKNSK